MRSSRTRIARRATRTSCHGIAACGSSTTARHCSSITLGWTRTISTHVLLPYAATIGAAHDRLAPLVTEELLGGIVALVPDAWLEPTGPAAAIGGPDEQRAAYVRYLLARVASRDALVDSIEEVRHAA